MNYVTLRLFAGPSFIGADVSGNGSPDEVYKNIEEALDNVTDGTILVFKAGSMNTFSGEGDRG